MEKEKGQQEKKKKDTVGNRSNVVQGTKNKEITIEGPENVEIFSLFNSGIR